MLNKIKKQIHRVFSPKHIKKSYSQCGEDLIIDFIFLQFHLYKIRYLDIGSHHPTYINNTALFYKNGSNGVCIEPDPFLFKTIQKNRKRDVCLNIGIGPNENNVADFYIMSARTLNTFSKEEADRYVSYGNIKLDKIIKLPLISINEVLAKYFSQTPDFISLDVEGYDFIILKSFDFSLYRPKVWCIETLTYTEDKKEVKIKDIIEYMISQNYFVYADTFINTIFVDKIAWQQR